MPILYMSLFGRLEDILSVTCGIRSRPTTSPNPKMPVLGAPIGLPIIASASSTVKPSFKASTIPIRVQYVPIRFPINPGVSLHTTTSLPRLISQNLVTRSILLLSTSLSATISSNLRYLGGLKKCVIIKSLENDFGIPFTKSFLGIVEVLDVMIEFFFLILSIFLNTSCLIFSFSKTTSIIKSASLIRSRLSSILPIVMRLELFLCIKGVGLPSFTGFNIFFTAVSVIIFLFSAPSGTISSKVTLKPAFAT